MEMTIGHQVSAKSSKVLTSSHHWAPGCGTRREYYGWMRMMKLAKEDGRTEEAEMADDGWMDGWMDGGDGMGMFAKGHHIWALRFQQSSHLWAPGCGIAKLLIGSLKL